MAAAMSRISRAAPSRRTRWELLDVARSAMAGSSILPLLCEQCPPCDLPGCDCGILVPSLLAQQHCVETTRRGIHAEQTAFNLLLWVTSRVIPAARLVGVPEPELSAAEPAATRLAARVAPSVSTGR
jgi:hypothetical protein